jgi:predicted PurR-regulated permease PerM
VTNPGPSSRSSRATIAELRSVAITGLFILAVFYTLHLGRDFFLPVVLALFLALLLLPVVRLLRRLHLSSDAAALLVLVLLLAGAGTAVSQLWGPAAEWVARAPEDLKRLDGKVRRLLRPMERVSQTAARVDQLTGGNTADAPTVIQRPGLSETLFGRAWHVFASALVTLVLAYFFLASGDQFLRKLPRVLPRANAERFLAGVADTENQISTYLLAVSLINLALGSLVALAMWLLGMPTPLLLGVAAAVLNFVPYLGPAAMAVLLAMVALLSFNAPAAAIAPPLVYLAMHATEANLVTPHLLGRRLPLNPTAIFLGFLFWWWIWGVVGALLAVPLMVAIKTICDRTESLKGVGEFLGR